MIYRILFAAAIVVAAITTANAHYPTLSCQEEREGVITCEGGFSNGAKAHSADLNVYDFKNNLLTQAISDPEGLSEFEKPDVPYFILLNLGPGHNVELDYRQIPQIF